MRVRLLVLLAGHVVTSTAVTAQGASAGSRKPGGVEYQSPFGFCFLLPEDWRGFSIVQEHWQGSTQCSKGSCVVAQGPKVIIRNPKWEQPNSTEDIPIMVFTLKQWKSLEEGKFSVSAAPFGPAELGRNNKYVFALPARYSYDFLDGWEQVDSILKGHALHAPCGK
jgi:hypothetical protein